MSPFFGHIIARDPERATEAIRFLGCVTGRRFLQRGKRRNFMKPICAALAQLYGVAGNPQEVDLGTGLRSELS